jgi:hypothetical protein
METPCKALVVVVHTLQEVQRRWHGSDLFLKRDFERQGRSKPFTERKEKRKKPARLLHCDGKGYEWGTDTKRKKGRKIYEKEKDPVYERM